MSMDRKSQQILTAAQEMSADELEGVVEYHHRLYWEHHAPEIDDPAFDQLVERLKEIRPTSPILQNLGPRIAAQSSTIVHVTPMLSLDKCYGEEAFMKWAQKMPPGFMLTPKIDGLALSLRYDAAGFLQSAATRGNGLKGEDVTANALMIDDIPRQLKTNMGCEIRGEVYMTLSRFNQVYADDFSNPRNLAAGALKQKDARETKVYGLSFFAYDFIGNLLASESEKHERLIKLGFKRPPTFFAESAEQIFDHVLEQSAKRHEWDYETDGLVIRIQDTKTQQELGETAHHPRYAIAYKFQGESATTVLNDVEWSVARTGAVTPVACIEPVNLSGAMLSRASLHHAGMVTSMDLSIGAKVQVARRGGVIPHIEHVVEPGAYQVVLPEACPSCQTTLRLSGDFLYCDNGTQCLAQRAGVMEHFLKVMEIDGFGPKHITQLIEHDILNELSDIYRLSLAQLTGLERMGAKLATKLLDAIESKRAVPTRTFLAALGVREVGVTMAKTLTTFEPNFMDLRQLAAEDLLQIHGVGESIADAFVSGMLKRRSEIDELLRFIELVDTPTEDVTGQFTGLSFLFTGKLSQLSRKEAQKMVQDAGGETPGSVTKTLTYLVVGDEGSPLLGDGQKSSKHKKAEALNEKEANIKIITETEFMRLLA